MNAFCAAQQKGFRSCLLRHLLEAIDVFLLLMRDRGRLKLIWGEAIKRYLKAWDMPRDLCLNKSTWKAAIEVSEP